MIGALVLNKQGEICLIVREEAPEIARVIFATDKKTLTIETVQGKEETLTEPVAANIADAFLHRTSVMIAVLDDDAQPVLEYDVPVALT